MIDVSTNVLVGLVKLIDDMMKIINSIFRGYYELFNSGKEWNPAAASQVLGVMGILSVVLVCCIFYFLNNIFCLNIGYVFPIAIILIVNIFFNIYYTKKNVDKIFDTNHSEFDRTACILFTLFPFVMVILIICFSCL